MTEGGATGPAEPSIDELRAWAQAHARTVARPRASFAGSPAAEPDVRGGPAEPPPIADWWLAAPPVKRRIDVPSRDTNCVAIGQDAEGRWIVANTGEDGQTRLWDAERGALRHLFPVGAETLQVAFAMDRGRVLLAFGDNDGDVRVYDVGTGACLHVLAGHFNGARAVAWGVLANGRLTLAGTGRDGIIRLWDADTGAPVHALAGHDRTVTGVAFGRLSDGRAVLASLGHDQTLRLWDADRGRELSRVRLRGSGWSVAVTVTPDDRVLVAAVGETSELDVWSWDGGTLKLLHRLVGHTGEVHSVVFAAPPGGTALLFSGGNDGVLRVWDPVAGDQVGELDVPVANVWINRLAVRFVDADGLLVASTTASTVHIVRFTIKLPHPPGEENDDVANPHLPTLVRGLATLAHYGVSPPLGLLADLVAVTGGGRPSTEAVGALPGHPGVRRLIELGWPPTARVGLAAVLVADLVFDSRFAAPEASVQDLESALVGAARERAGPAAPTPVPVAALLAAANQIGDQMLIMLTVLGADAVAADPALPLRLRHQIGALPLLSPPARDRLSVVRRSTDQARAAASAMSSTAGINGISRRGTMLNLVPTHLALTTEIFAVRYAAGDLLYRLHDSRLNPRIEPATVVLDTTPPTAGPVESVLRTLAHAIVLVLWAAGRDALLVSLDSPGQARLLTVPADLMAVWVSRTLEPAVLAEAMATAARQPHPTTILLTHHRLVQQERLAATAVHRIATTHVPGDPPRRTSASPYHVHLPPDATADQINDAVAALLTPTADR